MSDLPTLEIQYRRCLAELTVRVRLIIEHEMLTELKQEAIKAQRVFDDAGGQARIDNIVYCLDELVD